MKYDFDTLAPAWGSGGFMWKHLASEGFSDPDIIDFSVAEMKFRLCPSIAEAVTEQVTNGTFGYQDPDDRYFNAVTSWMERRHGWKTDRSWIVLTHGLVTAVNHAIRAFTDPGDGVLILFPSYGPFQRSTDSNGRVRVESRLRVVNGHYELDRDDISKKLADKNTKLFLFCSPHNPSGRVWTREELEWLGAECLKNGVLIVSDEIHHDLALDENIHTVLASISPEIADITITLTAPSKTFNIAGMGVSNVVISNKALHDRFKARAELDAGDYLSLLSSAACTGAYEGGAEWLDECRAVISSNSDLLKSFIDERLPGLKMEKQEGTYLPWVDCTALGLSDGGLKDFFYKDAQFVTRTGEFFGDDYGQFQRIDVACPRRYLELALERLERAMERRGLK